MSLRFGVLGLLAEEPLHGYQVKQRFEEMLGRTWEVNIGSVYQALPRLERDGLVEATGGHFAVGVRRCRRRCARGLRSAGPLGRHRLGGGGPAIGMNVMRKILGGTSMNTTHSPASSKAELDRIGVLSAHNLFTFDGALGIIFGVAFLALAPQLLGFYGIGVSTGSVLMTHILATLLLAAGITQLGARAAADSAAGRSITLGYLAGGVAGTIIIATAVASGAANLFGLGFVGLGLVLGSWRAYLILRVYRPGRVRGV